MLRWRRFRLFMSALTIFALLGLILSACGAQGTKAPVSNQPVKGGT